MSFLSTETQSATIAATKGVIFGSYLAASKKYRPINYQYEKTE